MKRNFRASGRYSCVREKADDSAGAALLEPLLSIREAHERLGISEAGFYRLIRRGDIAIVEIGGRRLVEPEALREFIAARRRDVNTRSGEALGPDATSRLAPARSQVPPEQAARMLQRNNGVGARAFAPRVRVERQEALRLGAA